MTSGRAEVIDQLHELMTSGEPEDYLAACEAAVGRYPEDSEIQIRFAAALEGVGEPEDACRVAIEACRGPQATDSDRVHAAGVLVRSGRDGEAASMLGRVDVRRLVAPMAAETHYLLAIIAASQGDVAAADRLLQEAIAADPSEPTYVALLVELHARAGDTPRARAAYDRYVEHDLRETIDGHLAATGLQW
jgi:Flp pilus assembly protein TadD